MMVGLCFDCVLIAFGLKFDTVYIKLINIPGLASSPNLSISCMANVTFVII